MTAHEIGAEIIESCRRGDRDAFRALYEAYKDRVYSIALYFFHGDASAASDISQQVFMKLLTGIAQFHGDSSFSTWLYRLVVNACVDDARRTRTRAVATDPEILERVPEPVTRLSHEDRYARARDAQSVQAAVSLLPPKYRMTILLRYFDELSYEEIASALNCSIGTVASRLNRGHRLLADRLAPLRSQLGIRR